MKTYPTWPNFYMEFANTLLKYKNNRKELIEKIKRVYYTNNISLPTLEKDRNIIDIDPFTVFGLFNKQISLRNRIRIIEGLAKEFSISVKTPDSFGGIPFLNNLSAVFYRFIGERGKSDIQNLWNVFEAALEYADTHSEKSREEFINYYNIALTQKGIKWNLTMGLFWIRPFEYINLDSINRWYLSNPNNIPEEFINKANNFKFVFSGEDYLSLCSDCRKILENGDYSYNNFPELSRVAFALAEEINAEKKRLEDEDREEHKHPLNDDSQEYNNQYTVSENLESNSTAKNIYTESDFLDEVYLDEEKYYILKNLLLYKKNIILQGPPGVGKTFAAKKLAYSIIGEKNKDRVMTIQFHQNYSYEDFMMGFRPNECGFELKKGPFYNLCKKAEQDPNNNYFFIIDEINRGNLSKIFGELFMLMENDKRGTEIKLLYSDEMFSIPKNLYIIGMMNTADRSLAIIDYALRRRFAFFEFEPAFDSDGFKKYLEEKNNDKLCKVIEMIKKLNNDIRNDESLGKDFCIGHSFFCFDDDIDDYLLKSVVDYEIIPLLNEYWYDEIDKVEEWSYLLHEAIK
ncbi:AAA family ATPase [Peptoclostridium sp. AF21-18]|uniref:AAA family ATPase n=1 Tax=Peptoclostridium sp. AF21-18 TaxID=2292243 RepID=UPI000E555A0C|nr:AAA family ATPase [Peptoclostridium sp. AF21-18]RHQ98593.1 AAA family ATPase [Peptoclostridium sp. AF21-18]